MLDLTGIYHRLPYAARVLAASARGWQLRNCRYGPATEGLVEAALERDHWPRSRLLAWQRESLEELLDRAAHMVPHYRLKLSVLAIDGVQDLAKWPVLGRVEVRRHPRELLVDGARRQSMFAIHTSGSTSTPLALWINRRDLQRWYALVEARWRRWFGVSRTDRWAIIGGQLVAVPQRRTPPFWVWNAGLRQLYLSAYHISRETAAAYLEAMRRHRVSYLLGYPSAVHEISRAVLRSRLPVPELAVVVTNAEPLLQYQREEIEAAFACPVRETYGMAEMVSAAGECEHGAMHVWPEAGVVEVLDDNDLPLPSGCEGRLVCTGLINTDMPLVRYDVGDRGVFATDGGACPCGRTLPVLSKIEGRSDDLIVTPDGRRVGRLDTAFKVDLPILAAQVIQVDPSSLVVKVVPDDGFGAESEAELTKRLRDRVGQMSITFEPVPSIPLGPNGKFRAVVSRMS